MTNKQFNIRNLPALTDKQIEELCAQLGMTKTQLVIMAIDRLYQQEKKDGNNQQQDQQNP